MKSKPINEIRRKDRAKDDEWIREMLHESSYCVLATADGEQPFTHIHLFAYDEEKNAIYLHSGIGGRIQKNIEGNPHVCLTAGDMGRLLPADSAVGMSVEYRSAVVFGEISIINDRDEAVYGLMQLMKKYFPKLAPEADYRSISEKDLKRTTVYRLMIDQWSGKEKRVPEDFPNAFRFEDRHNQ